MGRDGQRVLNGIEGLVLGGPGECTVTSPHEKAWELALRKLTTGSRLFQLYHLLRGARRSSCRTAYLPESPDTTTIFE